MPPKGEFEVIYVPSKGLDFSRPYNTIDKESLAPGSVNTQNINGFLCSSPWIASSPYSTTLAAQEFVLGQFPITSWDASSAQTFSGSKVLVVTNVGVYIATQLTTDTANPKTPGTLALVHTWAFFEITGGLPGGDIITFVQMQTGPVDVASEAIATVYFTGLMLQGVWAFRYVAGVPTLVQATGYVCGRYMIELAQRLVIGQCRFPTNGGPFANGLVQSPTIAWSGVGSFEGSGINDPWNPANFATLNGNVGGFNLLTDTPDKISGLANLGRSAIIGRESGLTQQDPGPSGIDPFLWYHLWASPAGVGAVTGTFQQYGPTVMFLSNDNVYTFALNSGITPIGNQIISKIASDARAALLAPAYGWSFAIGQTGSPWYLASIVTIAGQLHYLLCFSAWIATSQPPSPPSGGFTPQCLVYDYNLADGSWNLWDLRKYSQVSTVNDPGFFFLSTPITEINDIYSYNYTSPASNPAITKNRYLLFGGITAPITPGGGTVFATGQLFQCVALDYDTTNNPYSSYWSLIYAPLSVPVTTIKFRGENVALGHPIAQRRLRIQSTNAPFPATVASYQGQVNVTFQGSQQGSQTTPIPVNLGIPTLIENDYADVRLLDQMVQATINVVVTGGTPWRNLPLLRLATVSLIGMDPRGTTP
jgi:hypothetical protein